MNLKKEYIDRLPVNLHWDPFTFVDKNIHYVNHDYKDILLEDLIKIDLRELYPNILVGLFNEGLICDRWKNDIERVKYFLKNRSDLKLLNVYEYQECRIHCNSLYVKIKSPLIVEYLHHVYTDLINEYKDDIIHIDVDMIICKRDIDVSSIPSIIYEKSEVEYFFIKGVKRYIIFSNGQLKMCWNGRDREKNDIEQLVKNEIRNRRLDKLGICV